ncbi:MAG TPA: hypothetical protein VLZ83_13380 [Edaphocola sp.]|nr:hypothetical protein [Edaphocola sp.]
MHYKLSDLLIGLLFIGLIIGTGFMQTQLKSDIQIYMLLFGLMTLGSLLAQTHIKTSIPFYILLGTMLYVSIFIMTNIILNLLSSNDVLLVDNNGARHLLIQRNAIWGVFAGIMLSPLIVFLYHKKIKRNKVLEISLTTIFIIITAIIYIKYQIL